MDSFAQRWGNLTAEQIQDLGLKAKATCAFELTSQVGGAA